MASKISQTAQQIPFDLPYREAFGREDFLISSSNQEAAGWIDLWPDWTASVLILCGEAASGKTHLSYVWQDRSAALRLPVKDLADMDPQRIWQKYDALILEDLDELLPDPALEESLFHLYNLAKEEKKTLLITSGKTPKDWGMSLPDLKSRLCAAPAVMLQNPDDDLIRAVLVKMFHDRQLHVSEEVIEYIISRAERSLSFLRQLVEKADKIALSEKRGITIPLIKKVFTEINA